MLASIVGRGRPHTGDRKEGTHGNWSAALGGRGGMGSEEQTPLLMVRRRPTGTTCEFQHVSRDMTSFSASGLRVLSVLSTLSRGEVHTSQFVNCLHPRKYKVVYVSYSPLIPQRSFPSFRRSRSASN